MWKKKLNTDTATDTFDKTANLNFSFKRTHKMNINKHSYRCAPQDSD